MIKLLFILQVIFSTDSIPAWLKDFDAAKKIAVEKKQLILLNFSGSDWCGPCIRMRKEIFESGTFKKYAADNLVLLNADFPRKNKNKPAKDQLEKNESLAEKYNHEGKFPYTLLLTAQGEIIKSWDGIPAGKPEQFVTQLMKLVGTAR